MHASGLSTIRHYSALHSTLQLHVPRIKRVARERDNDISDRPGRSFHGAERGGVECTVGERWAVGQSERYHSVDKWMMHRGNLKKVSANDIAKDD